MFDIGFAELVIIAVVGLLVIGPERLPGTIRTLNMWLNRIKRGFNDIKREVEQELHNDAVMEELRKTGEQLKEQTDSLGQDLQSAAKTLSEPLPEQRAKEDSKAAEPGKAAE
jgi:sec-independent protein translocase protein TatB